MSPAGAVAAGLEPDPRASPVLGDREAEATEIPLPEAQAEAAVIHVEPLRWGGRGNVIAAAGAALLDLLDRERA